MTRTVALALAASLMLLWISPVRADVPPIKTSASNRVDACVTPGRLTAFLRSRNARLDPRFGTIAIEYMRHGERLGLRWDYTFYQMLLETGYLSFRGANNRPGDVSPRQNNFAGLGATGRGAPGESFPDVSTGVLAHLQHVLLYSGETIENPVAERTRQVQQWGILKSMQRRARGSVTFRDLARKWAPGSNYVSGLESIAARFHDSFCKAPDPHPEWVAEATGTPLVAPVEVAESRAPTSDRISGAELARRAIEDGKASGDDRRSGLGAPPLTRPTTETSPAYSILNAPQTMAEDSDRSDAADNDPPVAKASAAGSIGTTSPRTTAPGTGPGTGRRNAKPAAACRVWTASYGGQKALIIRVNSDKGTDFTVLDVNEGAEKREADAYIAAYAKGGAVEAEFTNPTQALERAFELCPEG